MIIDTNHLNFAAISDIVYTFLMISAAIGIACYKVAVKYEITPRKIWIKLKTPYEAAMSVYKQDNDKAIKKLDLDDNFMDFLYQLAPNPDGTINVPKIQEIMGDCATWSNKKRTLPIYPHKKEQEVKDSGR